MNKLLTIATALCLAAASGAYAADDMMKKDTMGKDSMSKDSMAKDGMKKDDGMKK